MQNFRSKYHEDVIFNTEYPLVQVNGTTLRVEKRYFSVAWRIYPFPGYEHAGRFEEQNAWENACMRGGADLHVREQQGYRQSSKHCGSQDCSFAVCDFRGRRNERKWFRTGRGGSLSNILRFEERGETRKWYFDWNLNNF